MQLFLKILSGKANILDSDHTAAVWSESALFIFTHLSEPFVFEMLGHLPYLQKIKTEVYFFYKVD